MDSYTSLLCHENLRLEHALCELAHLVLAAEVNFVSCLFFGAFKRLAEVGDVVSVVYFESWVHSHPHHWADRVFNTCVEVVLGFEADVLVLVFAPQFFIQLVVLSLLARVTSLGLSSFAATNVIPSRTYISFCSRYPL